MEMDILGRHTMNLALRLGDRYEDRTTAGLDARRQLRLGDPPQNIRGPAMMMRMVMAVIAVGMSVTVRVIMTMLPM
ncbi:hypothetical protein PA598K_07057, partial [Paenibacillus sp. 598K]